ncbi:hypothetical protein BQ8794_10357 [Mesorhizobium prunaredense]|uniref:Uncharacterized protein n=1 Tax=Mesorhizobium prunaredense TaxID=1631249 RepID=A0A1R3UZI4_9HYPH|nr:hypothetical protein BQ8794_10357 [Mesorhizobium prunaredense]
MAGTVQYHESCIPAFLRPMKSLWALTQAPLGVNSGVQPDVLEIHLESLVGSVILHLLAHVVEARTSGL